MNTDLNNNKKNLLEDLNHTIDWCILAKSRHIIALKKLIPKMPKLMVTKTNQVRLVQKVLTDSIIEKAKASLEEYVDQDGNLPPAMVTEYVSAEIEDLLDAVLAKGGMFTVFDSDIDLDRGLWKFSIGTKETRPSGMEEDFRRLMSGYPARMLKNYLTTNFVKGDRMYVNLRKFDNYNFNDQLKFPRTKKVLSVPINLMTGAVVGNDWY